MNKHRTRFLALVAALCLCGGALAEAVPSGTNAPANPATLIRDEENGYWLYQSENLRVEITRKNEPDIPLIWYEADLQCSTEAPLACVLSAEERPQKRLKKPDTIAQKHSLIYAQTDDFFGDRVGSKKLKTGVIIRNGKILYDDVYHGNGNPFPPLDALAIFPDGSLKVFAAKDAAGEQYLQMGALDVLSFGPILIRGGVMDPRLAKGYTDHEPRSALGMITPYHYFGIVVEGRHDGSVGCGLKRIAERMLEVGVTEALNLDGGQTAAMVFMGSQLNHTGKFRRKSSPRSVSGVLGIADR